MEFIEYLMIQLNQKNKSIKTHLAACRGVSMSRPVRMGLMYEHTKRFVPFSSLIKNKISINMFHF